MGKAATIKRLYKKHEIMFIVAVQKLVASGYTQSEAVKFLKA